MYQLLLGRLVSPLEFPLMVCTIYVLLELEISIFDYTKFCDFHRNMFFGNFINLLMTVHILIMISKTKPVGMLGNNETTSNEIIISYSAMC